MAEENTDDTQKPNGPGVQGASPEDLSNSQQGGENKAPVPPSNKKPEDEPEDKPGEEEGKPGAGDEEGEQKPDDKPDDEEDGEDKPLDTEVWGTTGDEVGDSVLEMLQNGGLTPDEAKAMLYDAVQNGDPSKIDRDALIEKVGKAKANLILAGAENFIERSTKKAGEVVAEIEKTVGGKDNWASITAWAKENVPAAELDEYRGLINDGGARARFAAQELASRFNADEANTSLTAKDSTIAPDAKPETKGKKLSKAEYVAEMEAAYKRRASETEIKAIKAARARGRAAGI